MLQISDLGLTLFQLAEVHDCDQRLVEEWLAAASSSGIRSPTGFFLTGLRSGKPPSEGGGGDDRVHAVRRAERWIVNAGCLLDREQAVLDELFDDRNGLLRVYHEDEELRRRMVSLWRLERPHGEEAERESLERAARHRAAREKT